MTILTPTTAPIAAPVRPAMAEIVAFHQRLNLSHPFHTAIATVLKW